MRLIDNDEVVRIVREEVKDEDNTLPVQFRAGVDYVLKIMDELTENDTSKIIIADTAGNSLTLKINQPNCSNQSDCEAKAIPVEWIKKWCIKNYPTYPRIITEELLKKTETWRMIEDWEEENETD